MKKTVLYLLLGLMPCMLWAQAKEHGKHGKHGDRKKLEQMRRQFIGEQLGLSEAQAEKFWPIYEDYLAQREDAHRQKKILRMEAQMNDLSDAKAKELLDKHLELQHREIKREEEFMQRFRQVITNVQVIKLVSLEHEFRRKLLQHYKERGGHGEHSHTE